MFNAIFVTLKDVFTLNNFFFLIITSSQYVQHSNEFCVVSGGFIVDDLIEENF